MHPNVLRHVRLSIGRRQGLRPAQSSWQLIVTTTLLVALFILLYHAQPFAVADSTDTDIPVAAIPNQAAPVQTENYPRDPTHDIVWSAGTGGLTDILTAFNRARRQENAQLGVFLPDMPNPGAATWNAMIPAERALWLINQERIARNIPPLHGLETNVTQVAQAWAEWLVQNDKWGHTADGRTPKDRLNDKPAINACHDFLGVSENLWAFGTTDPAGAPLPIERAVYDWMYDDSSSAWGHRHAILWKSYTENSGPTDREGFLGIGHARGPYTLNTSQGPRPYPYGDVVVMNIFDPCSTWVYATPPKPAPAPTLVPVPTTQPPPNTHTVSGIVAPPRWETITTQDFEHNSWPGGWQVSDANGAVNGEYHWIAATCRVFAGTYSGMAMGGGADGSKANCADNYPNNARSWMIYGPFSLEDAIAAEMEAAVWVHTELTHDMLCMLASLDRQHFYGPCVSGSSRTTETYIEWVKELFDLNRVFRLGSLLGKRQVYVAFAFLTNESVTLPHMGAYVDNIVLRKAVRAPGVGSAAGDEPAAPDAGSTFYGVTIRSDHGVQTMTDRSGAFKLQGLQPGRHLLTISRPGYAFYPDQLLVDIHKNHTATIIGSTAVRHLAYLPSLTRLGARSAEVDATDPKGADTYSAPPATVTRDAAFRLDCVDDQCTLIGPLE